ncbi:glycosyltransferase [Proteiniclasticum sp. SCR006]|uniref:Glycosyltransferase n=1 Tax=Proteiniclasticum aestuarii TaxID=2817862 RepID=A0A939H6G1_9CLOT|nr:glycosyltransferase [Proteiniclasticum aestuarii]MBO1265074.1 glycosyltransferase [Proteiniclasticum aestuarii]
MKDINILFVGGMFPKEMEEEIISKSRNNVQLAANNFQWDLINGFDEVLSSPVTIMNKMFIGSYPKNYKDWVIKETEFSHVTNAVDTNLGFVNITILKQLLHPFREKKIIRRWLQTHPANNAVFIYSLDIRFVRISRYIKQISPKTPIVISVMDLPEHIMKSKERNIAVRIWKKYITNKVYRGLKLIDGCMIVAENQIKRISKKDSDCVLVEALTNPKSRKYEPIREKDRKRVVYAGTLARQYNILNLVHAFMQLSNVDIELDICGDGDTKEEIIKASKNDPRINYLGVLGKDEVVSLMKEAWVLVNPRKKGQDFTGFSFPSKTIDYLLSGRPVICQKLEAIPNEYDEHLIYFENSVDDADLSRKLNEVLNYDLDKANSVGRKNYLFAANEKCSKKQIDKILQLIERKRKELE